MVSDFSESVWVTGADTGFSEGGGMATRGGGDHPYHHPPVSATGSLGLKPPLIINHSFGEAAKRIFFPEPLWAKMTKFI